MTMEEKRTDDSFFFVTRRKSKVQLCATKLDQRLSPGMTIGEHVMRGCRYPFTALSENASGSCGKSRGSR